MNTPQKIVTGIALLALAYISMKFYPWARSAYGAPSLARLVWDFFSDLLSVVYIWGAFYVFFSFIKRRKKEPSSEGEI